MARRVAAIFPDRSDAERAADALADLGADRDQVSILSRGAERAEGPAGDRAAHDEGMVEPAREVGDSGASLTTTDAHDVGQGAIVGAVAGLAAGLLALTVPGIGLVLAAGPLALAAAGGAVAGGVYGGLRDIGIGEQHARGYEERIRGGHVLMTAVIPDYDESRVRDVLEEHGAEDVSFHTDLGSTGITSARSVDQDEIRPAAGESVDTPVMSARATANAPAAPVPADAADRELAGPGSAPTAAGAEVRVPVTAEDVDVRKERRQVGQVAVRKEADVETQHISEPVTRTRVVTERHEIPAGEPYPGEAGATSLREGETVRVPVVEEELKVEKVPRVVEEVVVRTQPETTVVERDVQVRRERVEVEEEGDVDVDEPAHSGPGRSA